MQRMKADSLADPVWRRGFAQAVAGDTSGCIDMGDAVARAGHLADNPLTAVSSRLLGMFWGSRAAYLHSQLCVGD
jgi:hypothetical protein